MSLPVLEMLEILYGNMNLLYPQDKSFVMAMYNQSYSDDSQVDPYDRERIVELFDSVR